MKANIQNVTGEPVQEHQPMSVEESISIEDRMYDFIDQRGGGVSFVEIVEEFGKGDQEISYTGCKNVIIWYGVTEKTARGLMGLMKDRRIVLIPTNAMLYVIDGMLPNIPIAKRVPKNGYKTPHWVPMVISTLKQWLEAGHDEKELE